MTTRLDKADAPALLTRLAALERRVAEQEAELRSLRAGDGVSPASPASAEAPAGTTDRRGFVRAAAAAAAGAVVGGAWLADAAPAAAADGGPLVIGSSSNSGTQATGLAVIGTAAAYGVGVTDNGLASLTGFPAVLGHARSQNFFIGVLGLAELASTGVEGRAVNGIGVVGSSVGGTGVSAFSTNGIGVLATGGRAALRLNAIGTAPPSRSDAHFAGEIESDQNNDLWYCAASGSPGTWRKLAGPGTAGALQVLASTQRVYDSRPGFNPPGGTKGPLGTGQERPVDCKVGSAVPAGAVAVLANVTIVSASSRGFLAAFKNGIAWPGNSTINWDHFDQVAANSAVIALDTSAQFRVRASNPTHYIVDVIGSYG